MKYRYRRTELFRHLYLMSLKHQGDSLVRLARWAWLHSLVGMLSAWSGDHRYDEMMENGLSESISQVRKSERPHRAIL